MRGFHIRHLRQRLKLTQAELSVRSGLAQNTISKCETTNVLPNYATVLALARALRVDPQIMRFGPEPIRIPKEMKAGRTPNWPTETTTATGLPRLQKRRKTPPLEPEDESHVEK